jgi:hypothetical protein
MWRALAELRPALGPNAGSPRGRAWRHTFMARWNAPRAPAFRARQTFCSRETPHARRTKLRSALLAAFILPFAAPLLANAQQKKVAPAQESDAWLVGLPLYSSDGQKLGQVTEVVAAAGQRAVRAEMGTFLGLGPTPILIPEEMLERKPDRVEIIMTASEVKRFATRQRELKAKR